MEGLLASPSVTKDPHSEAQPWPQLSMNSPFLQPLLFLIPRVPVVWAAAVAGPGWGHRREVLLSCVAGEPSGPCMAGQVWGHYCENASSVAADAIHHTFWARSTGLILHI